MIVLLASAALAGPATDERWEGRSPPEAGVGEPRLTVLVLGASEQRPLTASLGGVEGPVERLGMAVFGLTLRGVPGEGLLALTDARGRRAWQGQVRTEGAAVVGFSWVGGPMGRAERLPVQAARPAPEAPPPLGLGATLALVVGLVGALVTGRGGR